LVRGDDATTAAVSVADAGWRSNSRERRFATSAGAMAMGQPVLPTSPRLTTVAVPGVVPPPSMSGRIGGGFPASTRATPSSPADAVGVPPSPDPSPRT
jgi:hypothetical protein